MHGIDWSRAGHMTPVIGYIAAVLLIILAAWMVWDYSRGREKKAGKETVSGIFIDGLKLNLYLALTSKMAVGKLDDPDSRLRMQLFEDPFVLAALGIKKDEDLNNLGKEKDQ